MEVKRRPTLCKARLNSQLQRNALLLTEEDAEFWGKKISSGESQCSLPREFGFILL